QEVMWNDSHKDLLNSTLYTQPALFTYEMALLRLWENLGVQADAVLGHSVGEYVAAVAAGVMSLEDSLKIVLKRAQLMASLPLNGGMMAVSLESSKVSEILSSQGFELDVAAVNTSTQTVVSGLKETLSFFKDVLDKIEIKSQELPVSHAFHSRLLDPILEEFEKELEGISFKSPEISLISNLTGEVLTDAPTPSYYKHHLRNAVLFEASLKTAKNLGITTYLEVGPTPILSTFVRSTLENGGVIPSASPKKEPLQTLANAQKSLYEAGILLNFNELFKDLNPIKVDLPTYTFDKTRYWPKALERLEKEERVEKSLTYAIRLEPKSCERSPKKIEKWLVLNDLSLPLEASKNLLYSSTKDDFSENKSYEGIVWVPDISKDFSKNCEKSLLALADDFLKIAKNFFKNPVKFALLLPKKAGLIPYEALKSLCKTAALEYPHVSFKSLEGDQETVSSFLMEELYEQFYGFDAVHITPAGRFVERVQEVHLEENSLKIDENASYLITGGLGDLGLSLATFLKEKGAKHLILLSRKGPKNEHLELFHSWKGVSVETPCVDVGDEKALKGFLKTLKNPIKGIIHAAGVLQDKSLNTLTKNDFKNSLKSKAISGFFLHHLTINSPLDFFIVTSSVASAFGSAGQANYAFSNGFLNDLSAHRLTKKLPTLVLNLGPLQGEGMARNIPLKSTQAQLLKNLDKKRLQDILAQSVFNNEPLIVADFNFKFMENNRKNIPKILSILVKKPEKIHEPPTILSPLEDSPLSLEQVKYTIKKLIKNLVAIPDFEDHQNFFELGTDSLMTSELTHALNKQFSITLTLNHVTKNQTVQKLALWVYKLIGGKKTLPKSEGLTIPLTTAPLSFQQEEIWGYLEKDPQDLSYILYAAFEFKGDFDYLRF
ncbi:MAG TPA: SDR family NAD(P)-dependent oxidoreductase, partial [Alphaproteobacteria bacterium]|nr:SDR family NAD(P)-dependent oxidoreductase [Alphaproteobacteria bacterium]